MTENDYFIDLFSYLSASLRLAIELGLQAAPAREDDRPEALAEHEAIAAAIEANDSEGAAARMREHLHRSNRRLIEQLTTE
ncbi:hypothetical protein Salmuc_03284 [Salipiger mucosus DSM 16094]|uniref:GntR C-terminal domain-containing protein n=1 Tax=Salipiger mucosus DSM 16094 TaxID=1123237 RepID=S9QDG0_9RHOB|nr:hypothetical protein Salmuc_03284 [Salipiger mucosus DSM 16094]